MHNLDKSLTNYSNCKQTKRSATDVLKLIRSQSFERFRVKCRSSGNVHLGY